MRAHGSFLVASCALALSPTARAQEPDPAGIELYEREIRPLLIERCGECHGPRKQKAGLRLDSPAGIRAGMDSGAVVVAGDVAGSRILQVLSYEDELVQMPPKGKLDEREIARVRDWVARGAPMPESAEVAESVGEDLDWEGRLTHWSFQPIADPALPDVRDAAWPRSSVDRFVLAALERAQLAPAAPTSRSSWLRRVTFDLVGLPPTPEDVAAFEADTSPDAYERVVDRLLASPHFGETWGRHWLDVARYAETRGHEFDYPVPNAWQYRDYVIRAFQADVPYDELLVEHVAGDLLEEPRTDPDDGFNESVLGTGFWTLGEAVHSPVDIRRDQTDRIADQVDTFSKAFLGLTVACARCHDHKFDAITQRDYYALCGFPLSAHYRQVRFDSMEANGSVAKELDELRNTRYTGVVRTELPGELAHALQRFDEYLLTAARVATEDAIEPLAELPREVDVLIEDFESDDFIGWTAEGELWGARPLHDGEAGHYQGDLRFLGRGFVNSHNGWRDGELERTDEWQGTLTSDPILVERRYVHFLVGGGDHEGRTCVQLLHDGEVVDEARGRKSNQMHPARFDVSAFEGECVQLRIVDMETGGWGNVSADHFVQSDREGADALDVRHPPDVLSRRAARVAREAARTGLDPDRIARLVDTVERARDEGPDHPLALWARVVEGTRSGELFREALGRVLDELSARDGHGLSLPEDAVIHVDYTDDGTTAWLQNGHAYGPRPFAGTQARFGALFPRGYGGVLEIGAAVADPVWDVLESAPGTEQETGKVSWEGAGRTLVTPTFRLGDAGELHYLVRGSGHVYAAVDGHHLIHGPLHGKLVRDVDVGDRFHWVTQDLSDYAGHRLHVEFVPRGEAPRDFAVALVVEATERPGDALVFPSRLLAKLREKRPRSLRLLAHALREHLESVLDVLAWGGSGDSARTLNLLPVILWPEGIPEPEPGSATAEYLAAERALLERIVKTSRLAPALLEGSGVDEYLLARGNAHNEGDLVPRAFLAAARSGSRKQRSSGRLELARIIATEDNPFVSRAYVNRVWHHLFGRGLAPSVDDLGHMGQPPTHPALLDHLARRFTGELGWSTKALIRELVLSSTYRQSSACDPAADAADPTNELLHRMPVKRITAEALRDAILAVSGELEPKVYGPSVPIHLTPFLEGRGRPGKSGPLDGDRRRSIYLSVRRNFLVPMLRAFDFPKPSTAIGRRSVSNVPAQALTLMNDPFVAQQARRWAERALLETQGEDLVQGLYRRALARDASAEEVRDALAFLDEQRASYAGDDAELDALADLCHVLYNVKEFRYLR